MHRAVIIATAAIAALAFAAEPCLAQSVHDNSGVVLPLAPTIPAGAEAKLIISGGSIIGEVLQWLALVLATPLGILAAAWLKRAFTAAGLTATEAMLAKFQDQVANGVALAAHEAQVDLKDKLPVEVKGNIASRVVVYVQDHGAETAKALGFDPNDPKFIEAVQARAAKVMTELAPPPTPVVEIPKPAAAV